MRNNKQLYFAPLYALSYLIQFSLIKVSRDPPYCSTDIRSCWRGARVVPKRSSIGRSEINRLILVADLLAATMVVGQCDNYQSCTSHANSGENPREPVPDLLYQDIWTFKWSDGCTGRCFLDAERRVTIQSNWEYSSDDILGLCIGFT